MRPVSGNFQYVSVPYNLTTDLPVLNDPVMIVMLTGWIDASGAANAAMETLKGSHDTVLLASFDPDMFIDYRARRPIMEIRDGINKSLNWSVPELYYGTDQAGNDFVLLCGPEPDTSWVAFATHVVDLAKRLKVRMMVGLGAYPFATPHTRPSRLSSTTPNLELRDAYGFLHNSVDVPAGVTAWLEHAFADSGIPAISIWAQIPHYLSSGAYPAGTIALLQSLTAVTGVITPLEKLEYEADQQREKLDRLVTANTEHVEMLRQMEIAYDDELPTGDDIAAELEQFLRDNE
jgi:proteasome assembly chaperone (PAC2) family protein